MTSLVENVESDGKHLHEDLELPTDEGGVVLEEVRGVERCSFADSVDVEGVEREGEEIEGFRALVDDLHEMSDGVFDETEEEDVNEVEKGLMVSVEVCEKGKGEGL